MLYMNRKADEKKAKHEQFRINVSSFGYRNGMPEDADTVIDVRFLPNPFYVPSLKKLTGKNKKVRAYIMKFDESQIFVNQVVNMVLGMVPLFIEEGRYNLNLAFGCTGGQHRSVCMAIEVAERLEQSGKDLRIVLEHRDH